jgi:hypothetical protein
VKQPFQLMETLACPVQGETARLPPVVLWCQGRGSALHATTPDH